VSKVLLVYQIVTVSEFFFLFFFARLFLWLLQRTLPLPPGWGLILTTFSLKCHFFRDLNTSMGTNQFDFPSTPVPPAHHFFGSLSVTEARLRASLEARRHFVDFSPPHSSL